MSQPVDWQRAKQIFLDVSGHAQASKEDLLRERCAGDSALRSAVERLLAADRELDGATLQPSREVQDAISRASQVPAGSLLGRWQIERVLGSGGMGTVYLARRADGTVEQAAALKLVRPDLIDDRVVEGMRRERQLLARLEHPNIARLIDADEQGGQPFYVMEFVDGEPLTSYCDRLSLTLDERIELFRQICSAIQHAHSHLVVHGDIKPGNVLVGPDGVPKLLDFGIAQALGDGSGVSTEGGVHAFSPSHAAPEQFSGSALGTMGDIYGLGVLLYELCCGSRPFDFSQLAFEEVRRTVMTTVPPPPSQRLAGSPEAAGQAAARARALGSCDALRTSLRPDLDAICAQALAKEPGERYSSAEQLSADLERWRQGLPVMAHPGGRAYLLRRFLQRHRGPVLGVGALFVSLAIFSTVVALQSVRLARERDTAQQQYQRAERVTEFLVDTFTAADPTESLGRTMTAREVLVQGRDRLLDGLPEDPALRAQLMHTTATVLINLGLLAEARPISSEVLRLRAAVDDPRALYESLLLDARLHQAEGQYEEAEAQLARALSLNQSGDVDTARALEVKALILSGRDRRPEAADAHRSALSLLEDSLGKGHPETLNVQRRLASTIASMGGNEEALALLVEGLAHQRRRYPSHHPDIAATLQTMAKLERRLHALVSAHAHALEALDIYTRVFGVDHLVVSSSLTTVANIEKRLGDYAGAAERYERSLAIRMRYLGDDHPKVAMAMYNLAVLYHQRLDVGTRPDQLFARSLEIGLSRWGDAHTNVNIFRLGYGAYLVDAGRFDEAELVLLAAFEAFGKIQTTRGLNVAYAQAELGNLYSLTGRHLDAAGLLGQALPVLEQHLAEDDFDLSRARAASDRVAAVP